MEVVPALSPPETEASKDDSQERMRTDSLLPCCGCWLMGDPEALSGYGATAGAPPLLCAAGAGARRAAPSRGELCAKEPPDCGPAAGSTRLPRLSAAPPLHPLPSRGSRWEARRGAAGRAARQCRRLGASRAVPPFPPRPAPLGSGSPEPPPCRRGEGAAVSAAGAGAMALVRPAVVPHRGQGGGTPELPARGERRSSRF
ncbi:atherin-like [Corvus kubaryi]|uniref:atherin-like n=1 Tax=Corvus kubaryi TaxID=68294 RepID=UPI001C04A809|nr:atherin-like [Corvus kubaryi]